MAIEYLGLSSVNGPFVVLEGVQGASFDEVVEITVDNGGLPERKLGRVVEINEDKEMCIRDRSCHAHKSSHPERCWKWFLS